jgi:preprotein translocase subunit SecF
MRLFRFAENANFDFVRQRYIAFFVTAVMVFGSLGLLAVKGLNYGIDFSGGIMMEVKTPSVPDLAKLRASMDGLGLGAISIQEFGEAQTFMIRVPQQKGGTEEQQAALEKVRGVLDASFSEGKVEYRRSEFVGPQVGDELKQAGILAFLLTIVAIMGYIWARFEWQFGVAAIVTLIHDTTAVIGLFALLWMQFDLATLAAVLMVAGYSTNDTVIIFDRIRENRRKFKKLSMKDIVNLSVNQTLARTLATSLTTLLALIALWVFGGAVVRDFVNAMIFGILVGTYSSIYVAGSMLIYLPFKNENRPDETAVDDKVSA